eukprot:snap_masked-scaffold2988_size10843-processed-gene-0.1 protein:Tk09483 transcript:snap_masked-scaffold2988_size10843-processed-gene-0.1-mRNA-1 annotation:"secreted sulfatase"
MISKPFGPFAALLCSLSALTHSANAQQVLIDFDDGIPGNNRHDSSVRNGGFEDFNSTNFATTPFWDSVFPAGNASDPTLSARSRTGSLRSFVSGSLGTGTQIHLAQTIPATAANLEADRSYTFSFYVRQGNGLENLDEGLAALEIVDNLGDPVLANGSNLLASRSFPIPADNSWGIVRFSTPPLAADSPFIGQSLRIRIQGSADITHFIIIDDVSLTSTLGNPVPAPTLPSKPNIVIIYSDDVGYGDIAVNGSGIVPTPHMDRIANSGIRFTDGHSPASTCTPSRYSMLTGEYAWRTPGTGIANGNSRLLIRQGSVTLPSMLQQAGYRTAAIGKWHLGLGDSVTDYNATRIAPGPLEIGFDYWFGIPATNDRVPCVYMENSAIVNLDRLNDPLQVSYSGPIGNLPTGATNPELNLHYQAESTQHEGTIINGVSRIGWMSGGQSAWWRDEDHADIFAGKTATYIKESVASNQPFFLYFASPDIHAPRLPHERFQGQSPHNWRGDALLSLDFSTGEVFKQLEDPNGDGDTSDSVLNNTLLIFTSDNGPVGTEGYLDGFAGRSPLPTDAAPDSEDILPALLGQSATGRNTLITQNNTQNPKGVRIGNWKYFSNSGNLHDLSSDPAEASNLANSNPQRLAQLQNFLTQSEAIPLKMPLAAWWPFDGSTGDIEARDLSDFKNGATLSQGATWTSDNGLPHLHFDGNNARAEVPALAPIAGDFTLSTWARSDSATWTTGGSFFSRRPSFNFGPVSGGRSIQLQITAADSSTQSITFDLASLPGFDLQDWHHYAATYHATSGTATLFIDGVNQSSLTFPSNGLTSSETTLSLGSDGTTATLAGDLSDARIYTRALPGQRLANTASARLADSDQDGMLSDWEHRFDLDPFNPADASADADDDGENNLAEFLANTSPISSGDASAGLISHWKFDEASGNTALDSRENHNGLLNGSPTRRSAAGRTFLTFDGTNRSVSVDSFPDLTDSCTVSCWAQSAGENWNVAGALISRRPQFIMHPWLGSKRLSFFVFDASGTAINTEIDLADLPNFDLTAWHHYAGTYDRQSGRIRLFVDGIERATNTTSPGPLSSSTAPLYIGRDFPQTRYLAGSIDDVKIFNLALTPAQLVTLAEGFDDDQDGLDDSFERQLIEDDANDEFQELEDVAPDGDGVTNLQKFIFGTSPLLASDVFKIEPLRFVENEGSRSLEVQINARAGRTYTLQQSSTLTNDWQDIESTPRLSTNRSL